MLWSNEAIMEVKDFNSHIIAVKIFEDFCNWVLVGFYGPLYLVKIRRN